MDTDDKTTHAPVDFEKDMLALLESMDPDARMACEKMIFWLAERPKNAEQLSQEQMDQMFEEVRLENIRRRLGASAVRSDGFYPSKNR
ncbi:MAG: hypothetical protein K2X55_22780 [Burkholderiaceae bacterium]|nr:hypothetical protein [Burkholderiaceae bacterium]